MFRKELLSNNIPVVMEDVSGVRSACLGVWVNTGSRYETEESSGISHFLEHMFFKGTERRSQKDIAYEIDSLGGDLNAFTSKETTTFYIKVLDEYLEKGTDLLMDVILNSKLPPEEIEKEKDVVVEEIRMVEDTPDDYVHDLFSQQIWGRRGLGLGILGSRNTVRSLTRDGLSGHISRYYNADNMVISCAGNIDFDRVVECLSGYLDSIGDKRTIKPPGSSEFSPGTKVFNKDHAEVHLCLGVEGIRQKSPERYAMLLINTIMGAGVSSRLFQEIRERRGLAYSVYSFASSYLDSGMFGVYVGTGRKTCSEVIEIVKGELAGFRDTVTDEELARAKKQLNGNITLALESTSGRMNSIARQEIYYGRYYSPSEIIEAINGVQLSEVRSLAERLFLKERFALTLLGPVDEGSF